MLPEDIAYWTYVEHTARRFASLYGYGELRTPTLESGCLAGISRELLLEWMDVVQVDEPVEVLDRVEEMFLVSTTRDVQAVHSCDGRELPSPGPVTRNVAEAWAAREPEHSDP